jgi:hypothetical protein
MALIAGVFSLELDAARKIRHEVYSKGGDLLDSYGD